MNDLSVRVAVPSDSPNGLNSPISDHFGHSRMFIVSTVDNGEIVKVEAVLNPPHSSCAGPVQALADNGVTVLLTNGIGRRPYMICNQLGISVVKAIGMTVGDAVRGYMAGSSTSMSEDGLCQGGGAH